MSIVKHMENKNGSGITVRGRVTRVGKPKMYRFGPKFYMKVKTDAGEDVKAMVAIGNLDDPVRETPFENDVVEFTTQKINDDGWASVTLKREFKIINTDGKVVHNKIICENKVQTITNLLGELVAEEYINEKTYKQVCDLLSRRRVDEVECINFSSNNTSTSSTLSPPTQETTQETKPKNDGFSLPCTKCDGTGKINGKTCPLCKGSGGVSL